MTRTTRKAPPFRIEKDGETVESLKRWEAVAGPKSATHWKPGRSAYESAAAWFGADGRPVVPRELSELLQSASVTDGAAVTRVLPEHRVRFDRLRGEPRNADVNVIAESPQGRIALSIEAKADEPFGERVEDVLESAIQKIASDTPTNAVLRVQQLAAAILGRGPWERLRLGDVRYQLLTGIAGAIALAREAQSPIAVFVVHEFVTEQTHDEKHLVNMRDLNAMVERLTKGEMNALACGRLIGPIAYPGSPLFEAGRRPKLYLAKIRRINRPKRGLGVFGTPVEKLGRSCEPLSDGTDWRQRFTNVRPLVSGEGGGVYVADAADGFFVVTSEGLFSDLLDEDLPSGFVRRFDSAMAREVWCAERYARLRLA